MLVFYICSGSGAEVYTRARKLIVIHRASSSLHSSFSSGVECGSSVDFDVAVLFFLLLL
eukprot:m.507795 g.507795  ORF g.507795 m.507795 type:complete len:59 (+) comp86740_c0_seq1:49-225(+)